MPNNQQEPDEFRSPPQDPDAELSVLGAMLLEEEAREEAIGRITSAVFYKEGHRRLFEAMSYLHKKGSTVDAITLGNELKRVGELEAAGGVGAIREIIDKVPSAAGIESYISILLQKAAARALINECHRIQADAYEDRLELEDLLTSAVGRIEQATQMDSVLGVNDDISSAVENTLTKLELYQSGEKAYYVSSGFFAFDSAFGGWERGKLYVVRGKTKHGKTLLIHNSALQMAGHRDPDKRVPVGYIFIDRDKGELLMRTLAMLLGQPVQKLATVDRSGKPINVRAAGEFLKTLPIKLVGMDDVGRDPDRVFGWIRRAVRKHKLQAVFLDSFSVLEFENGRRRDETLERCVANLANRLSKLAASLDIPIIAVSEVANDTEGGMKSKYSGRIDYAAYCVLDVTRQQDEKTGDFVGDLMEVRTAYHGGGMRGVAKFHGKEKLFRLKNLSAGYGDTNVFRNPGTGDPEDM